MSVGSFSIVLHGHMPYVLNHGTWPHGEDWLYEAAAETYLPLLSLIDRCVFLKCNPKVTIGITPVLLEQLAHEHFKEGFIDYLDSYTQRAILDRKDFEKQGQGHMAYLATQWEQLYLKLKEQFEEIGRDLPSAFKKHAQAGHIELLTSAATHGYLPLLLEDSSINSQLRAGMNTSEKFFGFKPTGIWLPEGAYRPSGHWSPAISWGAGNWRNGIEKFVGDAGITHFFVDSHLIENIEGATIHQPVWVNGNSQVAAFARDPYICEQVWSKFVGYPADGVYLEFHKKLSSRRGLRYWKITDRKSDLGQKQLYYPDDIPGKLHEHVTHFCGQIKKRLYDYRNRTGKKGIVMACFDTELFGHWWFEGPKFLEDVLLTLNSDSDVDLVTSDEYLRACPPEKRINMPTGSWGEGGDHRVWSNPDLKWLWEMEYNCEVMFGKLTYNLPWRTNPDLKKILEKAGRELLLLQASDWPFVISRRQAPDYGMKRFVLHVARFDMLAEIAELIGDNPDYIHKLSDVQKLELKDIEAHDIIFPQVDLNWWNS